MKRLILIVSVLLLWGNLGYAQVQSMYGEAAKADVKMKYVFSFEEALKKAKEEKKLIFFNCFADWAIPCHGMNKLVFSNQEFADWMDQHFVNFFMDVTTPEGRPLANKYNANAMAHYLVLDSEGNVVHRIVGGCPLPEFKEKVAAALSPKTSQAGLGASYEKGERGVKFLGKYATVLRYANDNDRYKKVSDEYFSKLKKSNWSKKENWVLFQDKVRYSDDEMFLYLVDHKDEFAKTLGDSIVCQWISGVYFMPVFRMAIADVPYDGGKLLDIYMILKKVGIPENNNIFIVHDIAKFRGEKNFDKMMNIFEQKVPGMDERTAAALDMSLKDWKELSVKEKKRVVEYLDGRTENMSGSLLESYKGVTKEISNPEGIQFVEDMTFEQVLAEAKKLGKMVFVDCYTSWCGPCKIMSKQVFSQKAIGEYFKEHFVSQKIDMEKGEGPDLARKYGVKAYPTMLLLTPEGEVKYRLLGSMDPQNFMEKVKRGLKSEISYTELKKRYDAGNRSIDFMAEYLLTMSDAGELKDQYNEVRDYLNHLKGDERCSVSAWNVYDRFITDYKAPEFRQLVENRKKFADNIGEEVVNKKLEKMLFPVELGYLDESTSLADLNYVRELIRVADFPADYSLVLQDRLVKFYEQKDYEGMMALYEQTIAQLPAGHTKLNLDVMLDKLMVAAPAEIRRQALAYAKKAAETAREGAKAHYQGVMRALSEK